MKRLLVGLSVVLWAAAISEAYPIVGYIQDSTATVQPGGFNVQQGIVGSLTDTGLAPNQCVQTGAGGLLTVTGANCGGGGGSSSASTLQVTQSGVNVTSPTASINFAGPPFILSAIGSTSTVKLNGSSVTLQGVITAASIGALTGSATNYIQNTSTLQTGATFYVQQGTVNGAFNANTVDSNTSYTILGTSVLAIPSVGSLAVGSTGNATLTGVNNLLIGINSGQSMTSGTENTVIGNNSGAAITTGFSNLAIGHYALSTGSNTLAVTAVGFNSCAHLTGDPAHRGIGEICIGDEAGTNLTTGEQNILIGEQAGINLGSGSNNTIVGHNAGINSTNNSGNSIYGNSSGLNLTSGVNNTCIGLSACQSGTTASSNTIVGYQATAASNGQADTIIGYGANTNSQNILNSSALGANSVVEVSSTIQLGNSVNVRMSSMTLQNGGGIRFSQDGSYQTIGASKLISISLDSSALVGATQSGSYSLSITVGNGTLPVLIFHHECTGSVTTYTVSDGATSMTAGTNNSLAAGVFYVTLPSPGSHTINVTTDCSIDVGGAVSLFGVDPVSPLDADAKTTGTNNIATNLTTVANNTFITNLVNSVWIHPQVISGGTGQTVIQGPTYSGNYGWALGEFGPNTPAGVFTSNWNTNGGSFVGQTVASWKPATIVYMPQLTANKFVKTDVSSNPVSYDLLNATQTFTGGNIFSSGTFVTLITGTVTMTTDRIYDSLGSRWIYNTHSGSDFYAGDAAGSLVGTGSNNVAIGASAMTGVTSASQSTVIGSQAGLSLATGVNNTFIGYGSGGNRSAADNETGIGFQSMQSNALGKNAALGSVSGNYATSVSSSVLVGYGAGGTGLAGSTRTVTGDNLILIGYGASVGTVSALTNAMAIGSNASVATSNTMQLGGTGTSAVLVSMSSATVAGYLQLGSRTLAQLATIVPGVVGQEYYCSDCTADVVCASTQTVTASWARTSAKGTPCQ